jgi:hypothetical protein
MRTSLFRATAALTILLGTLRAQDRPDFSGVWVSAETPDRSLILSQDAARLIEIDLAQPSALTYRLDGAESRNEIKTAQGGTRTHVSRVQWIGAALVITTTTHSETSGSWEWMKIYSLDPGTGALQVTTIDQVITGGPYMAVSTAAYHRRP